VSSCSPIPMSLDGSRRVAGTVVACAMALGEAGWPAVDAMTFARAMPYELRADGRNVRDQRCRSAVRAASRASRLTRPRPGTTCSSASAEGT
jgi:hypothetical protein